MVLLISIIYSSDSQIKIRVINAISKNVSINDGGVLTKNAWELSPNVRPDVYTADRTRKTKWVTFYTDVDSIRIKVKPGTRYSFIILQNGKDSCFTQVASAIPLKNGRLDQSTLVDTIPFKLTAANAMAVTAIINDVDTLKLHFDISSTDIHITKKALLVKKLLPTTNDNLRMGTMRWKNREVLTTSLTASDFDGRFGFNLFEGRQVLIDYDRSLLLVYHQLPKTDRLYKRLKMSFTHSYPYIIGSMIVGHQSFSGNFNLDTGTGSALILDSAWSAKFTRRLKVLGTTLLRDPRGKAYETKTVLVQGFKIGNFSLSNIPTLVLHGPNPAGFAINYLGNGLLKRFNMLLDFKNDMVYLKPNSLMAEQY